MNLKLIDAFYDLTPPPAQPVAATTNRYGAQYLDNVGEMSVGFGNQVLRVDQQGMWLGGKTYDEAPFKVNMQGSITAQSSDGGIVIDAANNRIVVVEDGVTRIAIGDV